jgi:cytochrome b6-f complex iron-sulfur subunit
MDAKKLSTAEILAKIRAQKAGGAAPAPAEAPAAPPPAEAPAPEPPAASAPPPAAEPVAAPAPPKPASPAAKPGSTKDILAAIRAQGAKGAAPAAAPPAAAPVAATAPAAPAIAAAPKPEKPAATAAPTGPLPSVAEMVRAARAGAPVTGTAPAAPAAPAEKPKPVAPPMPARPAPTAGKPQPDQVRRGFFLATLIALGWVFATPFRMAWTAMTVVGGISVLGTARFMFPNVLVEPPSKFKVGPPSDYPLNTVSTKWTSQFGVWIVHTDQYQGKNLIFALQSVCTHLGCTPNWLDGEQKFKCPCHGSGFYMTGVNFEGPAPRPLERMGLRVAEDGMLEVDKSLKFQEEMGQWTDPASFVQQT